MEKEMELNALGYDDCFASHAGEMLAEGQSVARVTAVDRGAFLIQDGQGETVAELSGKFRFEAGAEIDHPCVGDWVCVDRSSPELAIIHAILPRKTFLRRKQSGRTVDFQMIAANLDVVFIVQSCHYDFNVRRLERYLVAAEEGAISPVIILSKTDLVSPEKLESLIKDIRDAGITTQIFPLSNITGSGLEELRALLAPGKTFCLLGSSGVGKTTFINRLIGREELETRAVRKNGEGVHTTTRRQLLILDNGAMLVDTPGMRELGLIAPGDAVEGSFADINELSLACRFANCTHTQEPGCAILTAVETGEIDEDRYQSYLKLKKETEHHERSYVEKRRKDRTFGRSLKSYHKRDKRRFD